MNNGAWPNWTKASDYESEDLRVRIPPSLPYYDL